MCLESLYKHLKELEHYYDIEDIPQHKEEISIKIDNTLKEINRVETAISIEAIAKYQGYIK